MHVFEPLSCCGSLDELIDEAGRRAAQLGFDAWLMTDQLVGERSSSWGIEHVPVDLRPLWKDVARAHAGLLDEPGLQLGLPHVWCSAWPDHAGLLAAMTRFIRAAVHCGLSCGLSLPLPTLRGQFACMTMLSRAALLPAQLAARQGDALLLARQVHVAALKWMEQSRQQQAVTLRPREEECLYWAARGKTTWEIARLVHLSQHTVHYHLRNATAKLGASNRQQAVAEWSRKGAATLPRSRPASMPPGMEQERLHD